MFTKIKNYLFPAMSIEITDRTDDHVDHEIIMDGSRGFVFRNTDGDFKKITVCGWYTKHWGFNVGEKVGLIKEDKKSGSIYLITDVKHCGDPNDMYFIDCTFLPLRKVAVED